MRPTDPTPIERHRRRLHEAYGRAYEDAAREPRPWRRPGIVTGWRAAARFAWMLPVGLAMAWLGFKVAEAFASGRWPW